MWCAPRQEASHGKPGPWKTICLPMAETPHLWAEAKPAMMTANLEWLAGGGRKASAPEVIQQPVTLPPMTLSYAFGGIDKQGWMEIDVQLDWGEGPQTLSTFTLPPGAEGWAKLRLMGGEVAIRIVGAPAGGKAPDGRPLEVEVRAPPRAGEAVAF